jgi:hypothetical protein
MKVSDAFWKDERKSVQASLKTLMQESSTVYDFAKTWLSEAKRSLVVCSGLDNEEKNSLVCFIVGDSVGEIGTFYVDLSLIKSSYPHIQPISSHITGPNNRYLDLDDEYLDQWINKLGIVYSDDLCENIGSLSAIIEYGIAYAIDDIGEISLSVVGQDDYSDLFEYEKPSNHRLEIGKFGLAHLGYREPESGMGFCSSMYFYI